MLLNVPFSKVPLPMGILRELQKAFSNRYMCSLGKITWHGFFFFSRQQQVKYMGGAGRTLSAAQQQGAGSHLSWLRRGWHFSPCSDAGLTEVRRLWWSPAPWFYVTGKDLIAVICAQGTYINLCPQASWKRQRHPATCRWSPSTQVDVQTSQQFYWALLCISKKLQKKKRVNPYRCPFQLFPDGVQTSVLLVSSMSLRCLWKRGVTPA